MLSGYRLETPSHLLTAFYHTGDFRADMPVLPLPVRISLGELESNLEGQDKASFLRLMMKMLQWEPEKRSSMQELIQDEWICKQL